MLLILMSIAGRVKPNYKYSHDGPEVQAIIDAGYAPLVREELITEEHERIIAEAKAKATT